MQRSMPGRFIASFANMQEEYSEEHLVYVQNYKKHLMNQYTMSRALAEGIIPLSIGDSLGAASDTVASVMDEYSASERDTLAAYIEVCRLEGLIEAALMSREDTSSE